MGKMEFLKIKNQTQNSADLYIYGDIVDDSWNYGWENDPNVYPMNIRSMLDTVKGKDLNIYINSGGGHVFAGVAISNMLARHDGKTTAIVDGMAASIASVIAFGCDEVKIPSNGFLMIHKPMSFCMGNSDDFLEMADFLDRLQDGVTNTYLKFAKEGVTKDKITELVNAETWFTGVTAQEYFNIECINELPAVAFAGDLADKLAMDKKLKPPENNNKLKNQMQKEVEIALELA